MQQFRYGGSFKPRTKTEGPRFAGTAFDVDLRDYAPSFKVTRAAKGSRGGAIGGGQPMDTQEVSYAPIQKFESVPTPPPPAPTPPPPPAPTPPPPPAPTPAPAPEPSPSPQPDNSARDAWNAIVAQQGRWNLWNW